MTEHPLTSQPSYRGLAIQGGPGCACRTEIIEAQFGVLGHVLRFHDSAAVVRFDLCFPDGPMGDRSDNSLFGEFIGSLRICLDNAGLDPHSVWTREQTDPARHRYHLVLFVDGSRPEAVPTCLALAQRLWAQVLGLDSAAGLVRTCMWPSGGGGEVPAVLIRRDDPNHLDLFARCMYRGPLLERLETRSNVPAGIREYGASRIWNKDRE